MMRMRPRNIRFGNGLDCKKMTIEDDNKKKKIKEKNYCNKFNKFVLTNVH